MDPGQLFDDYGEQHHPDRRHNNRRLHHRSNERLRDGPSGPARHRRRLALPVGGKRGTFPALPCSAVLPLDYPAVDEYAVWLDLDLLGDFLAAGDAAVALLPGRTATRLRGCSPHRWRERAAGAAPRRTTPELARSPERRAQF